MQDHPADEVRIYVNMKPQDFEHLKGAGKGKKVHCHRSPDTSFGTILDEYALHGGWHPSCYRLLWHALLRMAGHDAIHLESSLIQNGAKGGIRGLKAGIRKAMARYEDICKKNHRLESFSPRDPTKVSQLRPTNQKKKSASEKFFGCLVALAMLL